LVAARPAGTKLQNNAARKTILFKGVCPNVSINLIFIPRLPPADLVRRLHYRSVPVENELLNL
jgi:hypothetical protein